MALRDKLEQKQTENSEKASKEQAALQAEQEATERMAGEQFQKAFQERASITETVENFQATSQSVAESLRTRQQKAVEVKGILEAIKKEDPDDKTTFREALKGANEEEQQGVGDSEEAAYYEASQAVKVDRQSAKQARENLRNLGIDAEGKSEAELLETARQVAKQKTQELRAFVIEHSNLELPEVQEVKEEMIQEIQNDLIKRIGGLRESTEAFGRSLVEVRSAFERTDTEERKQELLAHVSREALRKFLGTREGEYIIEELAKDSKVFRKAEAGDIETQALANVLKMKLIGFSLDYKGEYAPDPIFSGEMSKFRREISFFLKDEEGNIPEGFLYDDNSGITHEGMQAFYEKMNGSSFNQYAEKLIEIAKKQDRINNWEKDENATRAEIEDISLKQRQLETQKRDRQSGIDHRVNNSIRNSQSKREFLMGFSVTKAELQEGGSEVTVDYTYRGMLLFPSEIIEKKGVTEQYDEKITNAESEVTQIQSTISTIRGEGDGFLGRNKESKKKRISEAEEQLRIKRVALSELNNQKTAALREIDDRYMNLENALKPFITEAYPDSFKGTLREFLESLSEKVQRVMTSLEGSISTLEQENQTEREKISAIDDEYAGLSEQMRETRKRLEGFDYTHKRRAQEDIISMRAALAGRG